MSDELETRIGTAEYRKLHRDELAELRAENERLRANCAKAEAERDALLGNDDAVHLGAQAAISAIHAMEGLRAERDKALAANVALRGGLEDAWRQVDSFDTPDEVVERVETLLADPDPGAKVRAELSELRRKVYGTDEVQRREDS